MHEKIFLVPMSDNLSDRVKSVLGKGEICHRGPEFSDVLAKVRNKIKKIVNAGDDYTTIVLTGSGTAAVEAMVSSAVPKKGCLLVLNNGPYCQRMLDIAQTYNIKTKQVDFGFANHIDVAKAEQAIADDEVTTVGIVHHETASGILNPLRDIGQLCKKHNKLLIIDAVSSIVAEELDVNKDNVAFLAGSSNKGIQGAEGLSFVIAKLGELKKTKYEKKNFYFNLYYNYEFQERGQTPFTPAVRIFVALNEALDELSEEGLESRRNRYKEIANTMRAGVEKLGFKLPIAPEKRANTATLINLPDKIDYTQLHAEMNKKGFLIYSGKETLQNKTFRLCNVGDIHLDDINRFLTIFEEVVKGVEK